MVKKLPTSNEEIFCIGISPSKLVLLGLSNSTEIRSVDGMVCCFFFLFIIDFMIM